ASCGLDPRSQLVHGARLALAFLSGRYSRDLVRHHCIFLPDRPAEPGAVANSRAAQMDLAQAGRRKATEPTIGQPGSGTPVAQCAAARGSSLPSILHRIQCDFLVADRFEKPIRVFRSAGGPVRRNTLRGGADLHAFQRMAFRQEPRKTLACCVSTVHWGSWVPLSHQSAQFKSNDSLM